MRIPGVFFQFATVEQAAELLRAISTVLWPLVAVFFLVLFRAPITELLRRVTRAKLLGQEAEFDLLASRVQGQVGRPGAAKIDVEDPELSVLHELASSSPAGAIIEAHARIERRLRGLLEDDGVETNDLKNAGAVGLAQVAEEHGIVTPITANAVEGLTVMRNLAAHRGATTDRAEEYLVLAEGVLFAIKQNARSHERRATAIAG